MDLNLLKRFSRRKVQQPTPDRLMLSQTWYNSQPYYSTNPATGETVQWDKKSSFMKDAISQGFTPQEVERFIKESKL